MPEIGGRPIEFCEVNWRIKLRLKQQRSYLLRPPRKKASVRRRTAGEPPWKVCAVISTCGIEADDVEDILADVDADGREGLRGLAGVARHGLLLLIEAVSPSG